MKSFGLLRTNPNLTSNAKLVVSPNGLLYFESFNSTASLGDSKYKKKIISEGVLYNKELAKFWNKTPSDVIFSTKNLDDFDIMYSTYDNQIDDIYLSGASGVSDTDYDQDFEYFAPLYIQPGNLPKDFIVFRVDGAGIIDLNDNNFRDEILNNMKVVTRYDLSAKTKLGKLLDNSFNQGDMPTSSIDLSFSSGEFTYWRGIDCDTGEYISKGKILNEELKKEMTFTQGNNILSNGFKENGLIYPFIINLKFLFDDKPATPNSLRTWSINRYCGFYGNLEEINRITPYKPPQLRKRMKLTSNRIFTLNGANVDPFERGYKSNRAYYVEFESNFYLVTKVEDNKFKVISDIPLPTDVDSNFNLNTITFGDDNDISYINGDAYNLNTNADMVIIEIDGKFHRLINVGNKWQIHSDYKFTVSNNIFKYYVNKSNPDYTTIINLNEIDVDNPPRVFKIYQYNFSEVKDFDLDILDTNFSKFEYELLEDITDTEEPKLYENDLSYSDKDVVQKYLYKNKVVSIPVSEYLSTHELYEVTENGTRPNNMWIKNNSVTKWGIDGSISNGDYPYMFNVNRKGDSYNRTTDTSELIPNRQSRNCDYFYTLCDSSFNFGYDSEVQYQSLSIASNSNFDIDKYFNYGTYSHNYFDEIFSQNELYNNRLRPQRKYSEFQEGDQVMPNRTLFKGLNISTFKVDSVLTDISGDKKHISSLNIEGTNDLKDYKFSIILSELNKNIDTDFSTNNNSSEWGIIKNWERNTRYKEGDIVFFDGASFRDVDNNYGFNGYGTESSVGTDIPTPYIYPDGSEESLIIDSDTNLLSTPKIASGPNRGVGQLFRCTSDTIIEHPLLNITDDPNWDTFPNGYRTIFYDPNNNYNEWDPLNAPYTHLVDTNGVSYNYLQYFTYYRGEYYKCVKSQMGGEFKSPDYVGISIVNGLQVKYWEKVTDYLTTTNYEKDEIVTLNGSLYYYSTLSQTLNVIHDFTPIGETPYRIYDIIKFNDNLYVANKPSSVLDNGINIYINKKWKNILVHVYFNDNMTSTYNVKRDDLYQIETQQIVASNFIEVINNITLLNGFINPLKYYVIDENGTYTKYDINNIEDLPYVLQIESPVEIDIYSHSLNLSAIDVNQDIIKVTKYLENNELSSISQINYFNNSFVAYRYDRLDIFSYEDKTDILYRFNGLYEPIFKSINIFNNIEDNRYTFNEAFENFGEIDEMVKSKVGENNLLRIKDSSYRSIYPQVDEIGYFIDNQSIFKSTWDTKYYKKITKNIT